MRSRWNVKEVKTYTVKSFIKIQNIDDNERELMNIPMDKSFDKIKNLSIYFRELMML